MIFFGIKLGMLCQIPVDLNLKHQSVTKEVNWAHQGGSAGKELITKPDNLSSILGTCGGGREPASTSSSLTSTCMPWRGGGGGCMCVCLCVCV